MSFWGGSIPLLVSGLWKMHIVYIPLAPLYVWSKLIWSNVIPLIKFLLIWVLLHDKLPSNENLMIIEYHLPSVCNLCLKQADSSNHLFVHCPFSLAWWKWMEPIFPMTIHLNSTNDILILAREVEALNASW